MMPPCLFLIGVGVVSNVGITAMGSHFLSDTLIQGTVAFGFSLIAGDEAAVKRGIAAARQQLLNIGLAQIHIRRRNKGDFPFPKLLYHLQHIGVGITGFLFPAPLRLHPPFPWYPRFPFHRLPDFGEGHFPCPLLFLFFPPGFFLRFHADPSEVGISQFHSHHIKEVGRAGEGAEHQGIKHIEGNHAAIGQPVRQLFRVLPDGKGGFTVRAV